MANDDEPKAISGYDFNEDAMGLGAVYDEQGRTAKSAKFVQDDGIVELVIEFDRKLG